MNRSAHLAQPVSFLSNLGLCRAPLGGPRRLWLPEFSWCLLTSSLGGEYPIRHSPSSTPSNYPLSCCCSASVDGPPGWPRIDLLCLILKSAFRFNKKTTIKEDSHAGSLVAQFPFTKQAQTHWIPSAHVRELYQVCKPPTQGGQQGPPLPDSISSF